METQKREINHPPWIFESFFDNIKCNATGMDRMDRMGSFLITSARKRL